MPSTYRQYKIKYLYARFVPLVFSTTSIKTSLYSNSTWHKLWQKGRTLVQDEFISGAYDYTSTVKPQLSRPSGTRVNSLDNEKYEY